MSVLLRRNATGHLVVSYCERVSLQKGSHFKAAATSTCPYRDRSGTGWARREADRPSCVLVLFPCGRAREFRLWCWHGKGSLCGGPGFLGGNFIRRRRLAGSATGKTFIVIFWRVGRLVRNFLEKKKQTPRPM